MFKNIALFGEAQKGRFNFPYLLSSMESLYNTLGELPEDSIAISLAIQTLLFENKLIFFRVTQEGFGAQDYLEGFKFLENKNNLESLHALALPGVGDKSIIDATKKICDQYKSLLIITEKDLYDYLTVQCF